MLPTILRKRGYGRPGFDDFNERFFFGPPAWNREAETTWAPRTDIHENENEVLLDIELPGLEKSDIKVEVKDGVLTVSGERTRENESKDENCHRLERHYGRFERTFTLSDAIEADKVSAEYKNGVLGLQLPKAEKAKPKEIEVAVK